MDWPFGKDKGVHQMRKEYKKRGLCSDKHKPHRHIKYNHNYIVHVPMEKVKESA